MQNSIKLFTLTFLLSLGLNNTFSQSDTSKVKNKSKSGWSFGALPVIAYDSDIGFKYGALANIYHYGDGSIYPEYKHSIFVEWSRTTKGSGINQLTYDSKYLIPNVRTSGEISYLTENALDFYGYNGYQAYYNSALEEDDGNPEYISTLFYRQQRQMLRLRADFSGALKPKNLNWVLGAVFYDIKLDTVKSDNVNGGLYGSYKDWGVLSDDDYYGGQSSLLKTGLIYDSRDNEPNPMQGIWTEFFLMFDPGITGSNSSSYGKFSLTHRQYFTLLPDQLSFTYRLAYQGKLYGTAPAYMLPFIVNNGRSTDRDGLGGSKNLRGILRNRVVGEDMAYANFELRWKFLRTVVWNQNLYLALSAFTDMGMVTRAFPVNTENVTEPQFFPDTNESIHQSVGAGFRIALNENFIVAIDYGKALDNRDGDTGLYIHLGWLY